MTVSSKRGHTLVFTSPHDIMNTPEEVTTDVRTLCTMVDRRDVIIGNANAELLKRGHMISELQQKCDRLNDGLVHIQLARTDLIGEISKLNASGGVAVELYEENEMLEEELKCIKLAKDKTDAENTRLWALDKNEMHRKYEELIGRYNALDDHCQLTLNTLNHTNEQFKEYRTQYNDTENAYRACSHENFELNARCAELQTLCDNQSKRLAEMLEMLGGKEYTVTCHGDCIRYTVV